MTLLSSIIILFVFIFIVGFCTAIAKNREMKNGKTEPEEELPGVVLTERVPDPFEGFSRNKRKDKE